MIIDKIKASIKDGMKAKASDKVALLRLVVGTVQQDGDDSDSAVEKVIRKLIKSNKETMDAITEQAQDSEIGTPIVSDDVTKLSLENSMLELFIPKLMTVDEIVTFITDNGFKFSDNGKDIGSLMKILKCAGMTVRGTDIKAAIKQLSES
jgi:uncharacterized protein YqeY